MATLFDCPGCGQRLRLQAGLEHYWMQCPACAGIFVPQQLPFRLPVAGEFGRAEANNEEATAEMAWAHSPALDVNQEDKDGGVWRKSFPNLRRDCEPHRALWI